MKEIVRYIKGVTIYCDKPMTFLPPAEWNIFGTDKDDEEVVLGRGARKKLEPNVYLVSPEILYRLQPEYLDRLLSNTLHYGNLVFYRVAGPLIKELYSTQNAAEKLGLLKTILLFWSPMLTGEGLIDPTKKELQEILISYGRPDNVGIELLHLCLPSLVPDLGYEKTRTELEEKLKRLSEKKREIIERLSKHFGTQPLNILYFVWNKKIDKKYLLSEREAETEMYKILDKLENPKKNTIPNLLAFSNAYGSLIAKGIREEVPKNLSSPTGLRIFDEIGLHIVEVLSKENLITNQEQKELIKTEPLTRILYPSVYIFNSLRGKGLELANKTFEEWVDKSSKLIR